VIHPPTTLFVIGIVYLIWGLAENVYLYHKKGRLHDPLPDLPNDAPKN
jgi:hypothetical protein